MFSIKNNIMMYNKQRIGTLERKPQGFIVTDIRQKKKTYESLDEAFNHFTSFDWISVLGKSYACAPRNSCIIKKPVCQRWAIK